MKNSIQVKPFSALKVALAGLGGVGGCCARALYGCGVADLVVSDFDVFQPKNVSCQFFASRRTVAVRKTDAVRDGLARRVDSPTRIQVFHADLTRADAAERLIAGADLVISALDNFSAQSVAGLACEKAGIPFALVSSIGFCTQFTLYLPDPLHAYSLAWKHFFRRPGQQPMTWDSPESRRIMNLQSVLFAALLSGYTESAIRTMLDRFRRDGKMQYNSICSASYSAAAFGVFNALRYVTGQGGQ